MKALPTSAPEVLVLRWRPHGVTCSRINVRIKNTKVDMSCLTLFFLSLSLSLALSLPTHRYIYIFIFTFIFISIFIFIFIFISIYLFILYRYTHNQWANGTPKKPSQHAISPTSWHRRNRRSARPSGWHRQSPRTELASAVTVAVEKITGVDVGSFPDVDCIEHI